MRLLATLAAVLSGLSLGVLAAAAQSSQLSSSTSGGFDDSQSFHDDSSTGSSPVAPVMVLTAGQLSNQLLSSTGIDPASPVEVYATYADAQQHLSLSLRPDVQPNMTVFASVLIAPKLQTASGNHHPDAGFTTFAIDDESELGPRTQLYYNCTSVASVTNLLEDSNAVSLISFHTTQAPKNKSEVSLEGPFASTTNVSASAAIQIRDCAEVRNYTVGQIIYRNSFFPDEAHDAAAAAWPFKVVSSNVTSGQEHCVVQIEMMQASLSDLYPNCRVQFYSTDVSSLAQAASDKNTSFQHPDHHEATRRRLGASSFEFVRNSLCSYGCGAFWGDEVDECRTFTNEKLLCRVQFYEEVPDCDNECGDNDLLPSQCLSKSDWYATIWSCASGYAGASPVTCRRVISCRAISENTIAVPKSMSWNLDVNGSIVNPERVLYEAGDCSDPTDPRSDCCRITCENCSVDLIVTELHTDIDLDTSVDAHANVVGSANITFAMYAPNGCHFTTGDIEIMPEFSISFPVFGFKIDLSAALSHRLDLSLKPRGSLARYGWHTTVKARVGILSSNSFRDIVVNSTADRGIGSSAIDVFGESTWMTEVGVKIDLLNVVAVGVTMDWETYGRLNASVSFPDPFPSRNASALNPKSRLKYGNCSRPHFMAFEGTAGFRKGSAKLVAVIPFAPDVTFATISFPSVNTSVISGCIATAYEAQFLLVSAVNKVAQLDNAKRQRLKKILAWALGFPDIDASAIQISSVSVEDGSIVVSLAVPPSIAASFPIAYSLETEMYDRARTSQFANLMTSEIGFQVASACDDGWWGPSYDDRCYASNCTTVFCNAVDGNVLSCGACDTGSWGQTCELSCASDSDHHCASGATICAQGSGDFDSCEACARGFWGEDCANDCTTTNAACTTPSCQQQDGKVLSCGACDTGSWGQTCELSCASDSDHHCASGATICAQGSGDFDSCEACARGFWGEDCANDCTTTNAACTTPSCQQQDGKVLSCGACATGSWGQTCELSCASDSDHHCASGATICAQGSGDFDSCEACARGFWGEDCANDCTTTNAACTTPSCQQQDGKVLSCGACATGSWGQTCELSCASDSDHHCASGATICAQGSGDFDSCEACARGFWGEDCANDCTTTNAACTTPSCQQQDGKVLSCGACATGSWGQTCELSCASDSDHHCASGATICAQGSGDFDSCEACARGFWGEDCANDCTTTNAACTTPSCQQQDGKVLSCGACATGSWGQTCELSCASDSDHHCASGATICAQGSGDFDSCEACARGFWGEDCANDCTTTNAACTTPSCQQQDGKVLSCGACATGSWGQTCELSCASDSDHHCASGATICAQGSGDFDSCEACARGFWGEDCANDCTTTNAACTTPSCQQQDGKVLSCGACATGSWGQTCELSCASDSDHHCASGATICAQGSGDFDSCEACARGFWGEDCANDCTTTNAACTTPSCQQQDGKVLSCGACATGSWGQTCELSCASDSDHHCASGATICAQGSGDFDSCEACARGFWGEDCANDCTTTNAACTTPSCQQQDGKVLSCGACATGSWGQTCELSCASDSDHHCASGATICAQGSGDFDSCEACARGFWGEDCANDCTTTNAACTTPSCQQQDGKVLSCGACATGSWGPACNQDCAVDDGVHHCATNSSVCDKNSGVISSCAGCRDGYWGMDCSSKCAPASGCADTVCAQTTGAIESCPVCEEGFKGTKCSEKSSSVKSAAGFVLQLVLAAMVTIVALSLR